MAAAMQPFAVSTASTCLLCIILQSTFKLPWKLEFPSKCWNGIRSRGGDYLFCLNSDILRSVEHVFHGALTNNKHHCVHLCRQKPSLHKLLWGFLDQPAKLAVVGTTRCVLKVAHICEKKNFLTSWLLAVDIFSCCVETYLEWSVQM